MDATFKILSGDGKEFTTTEAAARQSQTISNLLEVASVDEPIALDTIHSVDLAEIIKYCEYFAKLAENPSAVSEKDVMEWQQAFIKNVTADKDQHLRMLQAADSLIIPSLFKLLIRSLVAKLHNKTAPQIREEWDIIDDLDDNEKKEIFESTSWLRAPTTAPDSSSSA